MKSFVYESHTAGMRMKIESDSIEERFEAGSEAMDGLARKIVRLKSVKKIRALKNCRII